MRPGGASSATSRVERDHRPELAVRGRQVEEIARAELDLRVIPAARGDHGRRQVDADGADAVVGEPGRDVPGAAAHVSDRRARLRLLDEAGQQGPVERLARELVAELRGVLLGDRVVAAAHGLVTSGLAHDQSASHARPN